MADTQALVVLSKGEKAQIEQIEKSLLTNEEFQGIADEDPGEVSREIIAQLLEAGSDAELERVEAVGWRDELGTPVEIRNVVARPSSFEEGHRLFMVVRGIDLRDGAQIVLTTGSGQVMAQLVNRAKRGTLVGAKVKAVTTSKPTKQGFYPYWLTSVEGDGAPTSESLRKEGTAAA